MVCGSIATIPFRAVCGLTTIPLLPTMIHQSLAGADQPRTAVPRSRAATIDLVPELAGTYVTNQNATCVRIANALNFDPASVKFVGLSCLATLPCR